MQFDIVLQLYLNDLMSFFTSLELSTCIHEFESYILNLLKPLLKCYILHLLVYFETHKKT